MFEDQLKNCDPDDIFDVLQKVETSFGITLSNDLRQVNTFGQLCDVIMNEIKGTPVEDCTTQQSFYKLRKAISIVVNTNPKLIDTNSSLATLFPRETRREKMALLEKELGYEIGLLKPPQWMTNLSFLLLLLSVISMFFNGLVAMTGFIFSILAMRVSVFFANELAVEKVGQAAEKMTRERYSQSRRKPDTVNRKEMEKVLLELFSVGLLLDKSKLGRDAIIAW